MKEQREYVLEREKLYQNINFIKKDPKLFKLMLNNLELYTLKKFIKNLSGTTIRKLYTDTIKSIFWYVFEDKKIPKELLNEGYNHVLENSVRKKAIEETLYKHKNLSETNLVNIMIALMKNHNIKYPSYDKFQGILENFVKYKILIVRKNTIGRGKFYILNPHFYENFNSIFEEILNL